jgi:hypothetical protein
MSYYANSEERAELIAGLRELAEYLDQNPDVPAPCWTDLLVFPPAGSDAEMFTEIDAIASRIGATASDADSPAGHYSASRDFGPGPVPRRRHPARRPQHREPEGGLAMLHLILCAAVLVAGFLTTGLAVVIIGIHRSEHGKRLTGRPDGLSETIARRLLVGSRGCRDEEGPR